MAFALEEIIEIAISGIWAGETWSNVWHYQGIGAIAGLDAVAVGEAWWNHVKSTYRALAVSSQGGAFNSVLVKSITHLDGEYGEFPVPTAERVGTRTPPTNGQLLPSSNAAAVRLSVASRVTRPGQKRFTFLVEDDTSSNDIQSAFLALLQTHMSVMAANMLLGAPALAAELDPIVLRKGVDGSVGAFQPITGFFRNGSVSSQVSRKAGRGI